MTSAAKFIEFATAPRDAQPADVIHDCVAEATRTGLPVRTEIFDVIVWAFPDDDPQLLIKAWAKQASRPWAINRTALVFQTFR